MGNRLEARSRWQALTDSKDMDELVRVIGFLGQEMEEAIDRSEVTDDDKWAACRVVEKNFAQIAIKHSVG